MVDEKPIWNVIAGRIGFCAIVVAHELELFECLKNDAKSLSELSVTMGLEERPVEALSLMLVNLGFLDFKDDKLVYSMVLSNLGHAYQRIEDEQNAAAYFEKAASATDSPIREDALFNLGLMYEKLGEAAKSQKMLQEILNNHPDSIYFDLVEEELNVSKK